MDAVLVKRAIEAADRALYGRGRVLVRASGTEPLIRVMVERRARRRPTRSAPSSHERSRKRSASRLPVWFTTLAP